ncbi:hypothetical protein FOZ63_025901 [Perkinsus olseni]|uniref:Uncharacterized protein n=1 Tax=Perkinsus olseni TaxID=32597 RepID=A0A7J6U3W9_PEROL|nr:hypothetical protein FOZ62_024201 [Perkinsus olseni]KAF4752158.1 hypothetical protein FOZ63_025901 [Perkinsus olseni]
MTTLIIRVLSFVLTLTALTLALQANPKVRDDYTHPHAQEPKVINVYVQVANLANDVTKLSKQDDSQTVSWRVTDPLELYFSARIRPSKWTTIIFQDADREGKIKAHLIDMPRRVANIFPLSNNLTDIIMKASTDPKDDVTCTLMIDLLERTPPQGYQAGWDWMKKFLNDKMAMALQLAEDVGKLKSI